MNPASMFVGLISPQQFFSVINRKIVENYKLNLFDVALDPFEVKIWFGENTPLKVFGKEIETYYSYCCVANLNGYRFLSPGTVLNSLSIITSLYVVQPFSKYPHYYFVHFLFAVDLLWYLFTAQLKVFPYKSREENYSWFIELFFNFYELIFEQSGKKITKSELQSIKKELLKNIQLFFCLFYVYSDLSKQFRAEWMLQREFYSWLFYDELKKTGYKHIVNDFLEHADEYTTSTTFSVTEKNCINLVLPADILVRYLFEGKDAFLITNTLVAELFDMKVLDKFVLSFLKGDEQLRDFILYITDFQHYRKRFFKGVQKVIMNKFKTPWSYEMDQEIEDFMSAIWDGAHPEDIKIPARLQKESQMTERLINFYLTFVGSFWISRGDSFSMRLFHNKLFDLLGQQLHDSLKEESLYFYGWVLYSYSKNVYYYKQAFENVRAGKEKANFPLRSNIKEVYSNMFILRLFDENFLATVLQDINYKDTKVYLKQKEILSLFKEYFGNEISHLVKLKDGDLVQEVYKDVQEVVGDKPDFVNTLQKTFTQDDAKNIRENLYCMDFWIWRYAVMHMIQMAPKLQASYTGNAIMWVIWSVRDTFFGFLMFLMYVLEEPSTPRVALKVDLLIRVYFVDTLHMDEAFAHGFHSVMNKILSDYNQIFKYRIQVDDNKSFLHVGFLTRKSLVDGKTVEEAQQSLVGEDILRFRGYLKNITYYNKRYLIPK